jgi:segregation and condensation protein B
MLAIELKFIIEALLFCSDKPLGIAQLQQQLVMRASEVNEQESESDTPQADEAVDQSNLPSASAVQTSIPLATADEIRQALVDLQADYAGRGVQLLEVASGFRFQTHEQVTPWVLQAKSQKAPRYSRALLETLAIIAYKQPITRAEIEDVRGIAVSSHIIKTLQERDWVRVVGHKDVPGKPALLATTRGFLDYFNLRYLQDLPALADLQQVLTENQTTEITV